MQMTPSGENFRTARTPNQRGQSPAVRAGEELGFAVEKRLVEKCWGELTEPRFQHILCQIFPLFRAKSQQRKL